MKRTLEDEPRLEERSFFPHWRPAVVRHCDLDPNAHVTNSVFAAWLDDGRYALLKDLVRPHLQPTDVLALVSLTVDFSREIAFSDTPATGTAVLRLGRSSIVMGQGLFVEGGCAATAHSVTVVMDGETRRARALAGPERAMLARVAGLGIDTADWS